MIVLQKLMIAFSSHWRIRTIAFLTVLVTSAILSHSAVAQDSNSPARTTKERLLVDLNPYDVYKIPLFTATSDLHRVAFVIKRQGKQIVIVDGKEYSAVKKVAAIGFSPDGLQVAYVAELETGKQSLVIDGKPGKSYDKIEAWSFSSTDHRKTYVGKQGRQRTVVIDDKEFGPYDDASLPVFSPDSSRWAFTIYDSKGLPVSAMIDGKQVGKALPPADGGFLIEAFAWRESIALVRGTAARHLDDLASRTPSRQVTGASVFGPDSKRTVYLEGEPANWNLIIDGSRQNTEPCTSGEYGMTFSPDGLHVAFVCYVRLAKDEKYTVYLDGKFQATYSGYVGHLKFSPDSKRFSYLTRKKSKLTSVVDGKEFTMASDVCGDPVVSAGGIWMFGTACAPIFSPDSIHVAWSTLGAVVVDGVVQEISNPGKRVLGRFHSIVFSPDGKRIAYTTADTAPEDWDVAVVDNKMDKVYSVNSNVRLLVPHVSTVLFSPGSKHTAYIGFEGKIGRACMTAQSCGKDTHSTVVIDGAEGRQYQDVIGFVVPGLARLVWDSPSQLRYLAIRDGRLFEVTEAIETPN